MHYTFKYFLTEVFDFCAPYTWVYMDDTEAKVEFTINGVVYEALMSSDEDDTHMWDVVFDTKQRSAGRAPYQPTSYGNQFTILSTMKFIIIDLISKRPDINKVLFTADIPSRIKAYDRLAHAVIQSLGNHWSLKTVDRGVKKYYLVKVSQV